MTWKLEAWRLFLKIPGLVLLSSLVFHNSKRTTENLSAVLMKFVVNTVI